MCDAAHRMMEFREALYNNFSYWADTTFLFKIVRAERKQIVTRISKSGCAFWRKNYLRQFSVIFHLFGLDMTGQPRPFAKILADRDINYHPNPAHGNNPIIIGHSYSVWQHFPRKQRETHHPAGDFIGGMLP